MTNYLIRKIVVLSYDIITHLAEWPRVALLKLNNYSDLVRKLEDSGTERVALVVPHPDEHLKFALRNLVEGLLENQYTVVVLVPEPAKAQWLKDAYPDIHVEQRKKQGRDFGAWKEVILAMLESRTLRNRLKRLTLANDSMYYNKTTSEIMDKLTNTEKPWSCLFENFDYEYHAQSFLLSFDNTVLKHPVFQKFWQMYKPYSSRRHSIHRGEAMLSRRISRVFGHPHCILNSTAIMKEFKSLESAADLRSVVFRLWATPASRSSIGEVLEEGVINLGFRPTDTGNKLKPTKEERNFEKQLLATDIAKLPEAHNPTHSVGLLVNRLFGYPVKRDICLRSWHHISDVAALLCGFSEDEIADIEQDLRRKGLPNSHSGINRILFEHGRI